MTGEISIRGKVKPVGGVPAKIEAAKNAGIKRVIIAEENWQEMFENIDIEVIPVKDIYEVMKLVFGKQEGETESISIQKMRLMYLVHQGHKPLLNLMKGCIIIHAQDIHVGLFM